MIIRTHQRPPLYEDDPKYQEPDNEYLNALVDQTTMPSIFL